MSRVNRTGAIRKTRIAQVAGLALVALVAGAVMYDPGLPEAPAQLTGFGDPMDSEGSSKTGSNQALDVPEINPDMVGGTLDRVVGIKPKPVVATPITPDPGQTKVVADPSDGWKYLGGVFEPNFSFALVEIDGRQRMLRKGTRLDAYDAEVISVDRDQIEIDRNGVIERVSISNSTGEIVSVATQPEQGAKTAVAVPGRAGNRDYMSEREQEGENLTDIEKRRAEFDRRMKEREARLRGENR